MKTSIQSGTHKPAKARFNTWVATITGIGTLALGTASFIAPAHAGPSPEQDGTVLQGLIDLFQKAQEAEVLQLLSDYHGALANGGNLAAMASLWADNSSLTLNNGTPYVGKDAVLGFFANGPYFHNNWVSLAPEWKTTLTVHGDTAQATTECIATDVSVSPNVVRGVIQVNVTCQRIRGKWLFIQMNNFTQPGI